MRRCSGISFGPTDEVETGKLAVWKALQWPPCVRQELLHCPTPNAWPPTRPPTLDTRDKRFPAQTCKIPSGSFLPESGRRPHDPLCSSSVQATFRIVTTVCSISRRRLRSVMVFFHVLVCCICNENENERKKQAQETEQQGQSQRRCSHVVEPLSICLVVVFIFWFDAYVIIMNQ